MLKVFSTPDTSPSKVSENYFHSWGFEENASAGFEFGRRAISGMTDWPANNKWEWLANLTSYSIKLWRLEILFRFHQPNEWRFWMLWLKNA